MVHADKKAAEDSPGKLRFFLDLMACIISADRIQILERKKR